MNKKKIIIRTLLVLVVTGIVTVYLCNRAIENSAKGLLYSDPKAIPFNRVGLLLGTSKTLRNGQNNLYYDYRIEAAIKLIHERKIKYLVVSGDNSRKDYNEPGMMRADLINAGIDSSII